MQPQPKIKDFRPGTPIYPVPIGFNAFLYVGNTVGGVLVGVSAAVLVAVLVFVNTGKMKEWTKEERRLEEDYFRCVRVYIITIYSAGTKIKYNIIIFAKIPLIFA